MWLYARKEWVFPATVIRIFVIFLNRKVDFDMFKKMVTFTVTAVFVLSLQTSVEAQLRLPKPPTLPSGGSSSNTPSTTQQQSNDGVPAHLRQNLTAEEQTALEKLFDESKRTAPKVDELDPYIPGSTDSAIRSFFEKLDKMSNDELNAWKEKLEARNNENIEIFNVLGTTTDGEKVMKPHIRQEISNRNSMADHRLTEELKYYNSIMSRAKTPIERLGKVKIDGDMNKGGTFNTKVEELRVGTASLVTKDGKMYFSVHGMITPLEENYFNSEYENLKKCLTILRKPAGQPQYEEYWKGDILRGTMFQAQRNSKAGQEKASVPASQMNNPELQTKMLNLAKQKYPKMGPVKIVIAESAWRPEHNKLGILIRRRINTHMIYNNGSGYQMVTVSFIEPYAGGGKYGAVQAYGIGTDNKFVDWKP